MSYTQLLEFARVYIEHALFLNTDSCLSLRVRFDMRREAAAVDSILADRAHPFRIRPLLAFQVAFTMIFHVRVETGPGYFEIAIRACSSSLERILSFTLPTTFAPMAASRQVDIPTGAHF